MKPKDDHFLLDEAVKALERNAAVHAEVLQRDTRRGNRRIDAHVRLRIGEIRKHLRVELKATINNTVIAQLANTLGTEKANWLLVTTYVNPEAARKLRDLELQFIDVAGNAYLNLPPTYVFIQGMKPPRHWLRNIAHKDQWTQAGVKVAFALLHDPELVNAPYRELAKRAKVALGTVAGVMTFLAHRGYILEAAAARRLRNQAQLLEAWAVAYAEKLRPKTLVGTFAIRGAPTALDPILKATGALWGGEPAAARLTHYLQPEVITIYAAANIAEVLVALKLVRDPDGKCEVRRKFWQDLPGADTDLAPLVLIYADLLATGNPRNTETARQLYETNVRRHLSID